MTHENDTASWYSTSPSAPFHRRVSRAKRAEYTGKWIAVSKLMHNDGICRRERLSEKVASGQINVTGNEWQGTRITENWNSTEIPPMENILRSCVIKELGII